MVRIYEELNTLEREGLTTLLKLENWRPCTLGIDRAWTKKMKDKEITVKETDFHVDED